MELHSHFTGGNIRLLGREGRTYLLDNEQRDTDPANPWFYWAFCAEGAAGQTLHFRFPPTRLGYYGPAVSHDLKTWHWLGAGAERDAFSYTFGPDENRVYFAHSMLYHPDRFLAFAASRGLAVETLCTSRKGRPVPFVTFGSGSRRMILTSRHHACESTGSYVLEGVLDGLLQHPVEDLQVICVPFVDYDGVVDGDQGKYRLPRDHECDYGRDVPPIYPETAAIRALAAPGVTYAFDFHSPWHWQAINDVVFIDQRKHEKVPRYERFAACLADCLTPDAMQFRRENKVAPAAVAWNDPDAPVFACYMNDTAGADISFAFETPFFGAGDHVFSQAGAVALGRCFARALHRYDEA